MKKWSLTLLIAMLLAGCAQQQFQTPAEEVDPPDAPGHTWYDFGYLVSQDVTDPTASTEGSAVVHTTRGDITMIRARLQIVQKGAYIQLRDDGAYFTVSGFMVKRVH